MTEPPTENKTPSSQSDNPTVAQRIEAKPGSDISLKIEDNQTRIQQYFENCMDIHIAPWRYGAEMENHAFSVYFSTLIKAEPMNYVKQTMQNLVTHEIGPALTVTTEQLIAFFENDGLGSPPSQLQFNFEQAVNSILDGQVVIFFDGWNKALGYPALDIEQRQTSEPITEPSVQGPHISFIENLDRNIGVIRNLLRTPKLKFEFFLAGEQSQRKVMYGYLDGTINPETLERFKERIAKIDKEEILDTSYLEEWIGDSLYSPFPQVRYTERPDNAISALLDGKIVAMVNGSPSILICPGSFMDFFMTNEDYYYRTIFSSLIRIIRVAAFIIALMLPSTYIALSTFHSELIPTVLLLAILNAREGIPFPVLVEALIMEFFFELLREAGIRLPRPIGSAVSIVGALVIGQAAIQSQIASPVMVIVVALTGIASFALPQYNMAVAIRILRFPLMLLAATFGGLGIMIGFILIYLHLTTLRSLGEPYMDAISPLNSGKLWESIVVVPRKIMVQAPRGRHMRKNHPEGEKPQ